MDILEHVGKATERELSETYGKENVMFVHGDIGQKKKFKGTCIVHLNPFYTGAYFPSF